MRCFLLQVLQLLQGAFHTRPRPGPRARLLKHLVSAIHFYQTALKGFVDVAQLVTDQAAASPDVGSCTPYTDLWNA